VRHLWTHLQHLHSASMIATIGFPIGTRRGYSGTETINWYSSDSPTSCDTSHYVSHSVSVTRVPEYDIIAARIKANVARTIKTVVNLMRWYKRSVYSHLLVRRVYVMRSMNSLSGWVSRKLKQRKGKLCQ